MMTITLTCGDCGSAISVYPDSAAKTAECGICKHVEKVSFDEKQVAGILEDCPCCQRKDFYSQKDFNRKIGVMLFVIAAILSIWTYGLSFVVLYLFDFLLFKKLQKIAICYNCNTIFRSVTNIEEIPGFDHEMNDRIVYSGHDFEGKPLEH
ncbi:MAG: hypothetical protein HN509_17895 [Halobacteriovoraceae bacterium]|jgi:hypothetical protein|nr:hypothetical protein [Halobacteriovoraceae bacterium]MBT5092640.1 hypothetical protein [Halobacteriovoraceae bacterium]